MLYEFALNATQLQNATENAANVAFDTWVTGTTNLTSIMRAPYFASQGHFFGVDSPNVASSIPIIMTPEGQAITPSAAQDQSMVSVEPLSGVTLQSDIRWQYNL